MMKIETENDITPAAAAWLRERDGLTQREFWQSVLVTAASGCRYEAGDAVPAAQRRLIYLTYVAQVPTDTSTPVGAARAVHAGRLFHIDLAGGRDNIVKVVTDIATQLRKASRALGI